MASFFKYCLINSFYYLCISLLTYGNEYESPKEGLPFCDGTESSDRYVFVSTLDGKLTALNPKDGGSHIWSIHPGSESMLSSSIHKLELSNFGHLIRMIPSLSGGLYKFNGENIEVIPVTIDQLLQSSFKYSDDLFISGGKETSTYGVSLQSGRIIYECSMKGCGNFSHSTDNREILVIQRLGQIVRAVEPRTGTEKWNFSVAEHDLKLLSECHSNEDTQLKYYLKVVIPEGMLYAIDAKDSSTVLWKHKFNSPVVRAWQVYKGRLSEVNLFSGFEPNALNTVPASIYIGMYEKQLYIQESVTTLKERHAISSNVRQKLIGIEKGNLKIPWKPITASSTALGFAGQDSRGKENPLDEVSQRQTTALSVLYASSYVDGTGFYLYTENDLEKAKKISCQVSADASDITENNHLSESVITSTPPLKAITYEEKESEPDFSNVETHVEIVIVSIWYYWKEILVVSITTAFLGNLLFTRTYLKWKMKRMSISTTNDEKSNSTKENDSGIVLASNKLEKISEAAGFEEYVSRYLNDFNPIARLGKGGFGVVFEAVNKIDDCHYAIKRILLPNSQGSRERVLREVKVLAKLDHHHIVRYFNAWTECPPPGWQEKQDERWTDPNSDGLTSNEFTNNETATIPSETWEKPKFNKYGFDPVSFEYSSSRLLNSRKDANLAKSDVSDSFIVFETSKGSQNSESESVKNPKEYETVTISSTTEDLVKSESKYSQSQAKSSRPTSLMLDQKASPAIHNLNKVYLYIQMQLCQRQSLKDWLMVNMERDYSYVLSIFEQILQAVEHVHLQGLIHRDLKPSNIFFSLDNQIKIGDFGLVTAMTEGDSEMSPTEAVAINISNESHTAQVGTQLYMSQEQKLGKLYNYKVDIYSLGLILFELLVPFRTQTERIIVLQKIKNDVYPEDFKKKYEKEHELLRLMLSNCPDERPTTYGIRARLPLKQEPVEQGWHFELPTAKSSLSKSRSNSECDPR